MSKKKCDCSLTDENVVYNDVLGDVSKKVVKHRLNSVIVGISILIILSVFLFVGIALSWFAPKGKANATLLATNLYTEVLYSLDGETYQSFTEGNSKKILNINVDDISDLKLKVKYSGLSSAYIRVRLFESFVKGENVYPNAEIEYKLDKTKWVNIQGWYYYKEIVTYSEAVETDENGDDHAVRTFTEIPFIEYSSCSYDSTSNPDVSMNLVVMVESVQPDLFEDFFGNYAATQFFKK